MNLMNLFNLKYLIQNIKKSKALVILLVLLVPMFTSILLLSAGSSFVASFAELSIINIIGMYIIPVVLSMTLFNYVYKKSSVDFIGSMPLSRKTIFLTNTIGGIGIILLSQLITLVSTLFLTQVLSNIIIFGSMIWDIFVFFTISYVFVFVVSNLAMSFSGNKFSQLVAILLILFTIPFITMSGDLFGDRYSYIDVDKYVGSSLGDTSKKISIEQHYDFTAPSIIFDMITTGAKYEYSQTSLVKMIVLSFIYIILGLIIFNKKKLELAGESHENIKIHLVVKLLTFIPFMFVYCALDTEDRMDVLLFFIAILAVYYFLFDLITNKKVKLKLSIPAFIISGIVMFAIYEGIVPKFGGGAIKTINVNDIKSVYIEDINSRYNNSNCKFDLLIEDEELIKLIVLESEYITYNSSYYGAYAETIEVPIERYKEDKINLEPVSKYKDSNAGIILTLKNGKTYEYSIYLNANIYEEILKNYGEQQICVSFKDVIPILESMTLSEAEQKEIIELVNQKINNLTYQDLYDLYCGDRTEYTLDLYEYKNHKLIKNNISYKTFEEVFEKVANICNNYSIEKLEEIRSFNIYQMSTLTDLIKQKNPELFTPVSENDGSNIDSEENINKDQSDMIPIAIDIDINIEQIYENEKIISELLYSIMDIAEDEIREFLKRNNKIAFDPSKEYLVVRSYYPTFYYLNDLDGFYEVIAKAFNKYSEQKGYNIKLNQNETTFDTDSRSQNT